MALVSDGELKKNALDFVIPISEEIDRVHFAWFARETGKVTMIKASNIIGIDGHRG